MERWEFQPARDLALHGQARRVSLLREVGLETAITAFAWRCLTMAYLRVAHRLEIHGRENLPKDLPFVVAANHSSHLDAVVLGSAIPARYLGRVFPIAAGDTFFTKPASSLFATACMNALPIWRKNCGAHALEELRERLAHEQCGYILFPEGTRTRSGEMAAFKAGLGRLVAGTAAPVVPCHLQGAWHAFPPGQKLPKPAKIVLRIGTPLGFESVSNDKAGWEMVAATVEKNVRALAP